MHQHDTCYRVWQERGDSRRYLDTWDTYGEALEHATMLAAETQERTFVGFDHDPVDYVEELGHIDPDNSVQTLLVLPEGVWSL